MCDDALALVLRYAPGPVEVVDIDLDLDLLARYNELVPVLIGANGTVLATGPLSSSEVKRLVRRLRR